MNPKVALYGRFRLGESEFVTKNLNLPRLGEIQSGEIVLPRNSTCLTPNWLLSIVSFNRAWRKHWKTARMFRISSVAFLAAIGISSTN